MKKPVLISVNLVRRSMIWLMDGAAVFTNVNWLQTPKGRCGLADWRSQNAAFTMVNLPSTPQGMTRLTAEATVFTSVNLLHDLVYWRCHSVHGVNSQGIACLTEEVCVFTRVNLLYDLAYWGCHSVHSVNPKGMASLTEGLRIHSCKLTVWLGLLRVPQCS